MRTFIRSLRRAGAFGWQLGLLAALLIAAAGCRPESDQSEPRPRAALTVYAAASLNEAFTQIGERFRATHPGMGVAFNFAGSQQLAQQLAQGAPVDVFASADEAQMLAVVESGRIAVSSVQPFAGNRLVVITPGDNPANLTGLGDLTRPGLQVVLAAGEVPVGRYTLEFLQRAATAPGFPTDYQELVLANTVSYEADVKAVLAKVALGEADAGVVYASDVSRLEGELQVVAIPPELNVQARYLIAPLQGSAQEMAAAAFIELVLSPEGQGILAARGLQTVHPGVHSPDGP